MVGDVPWRVCYYSKEFGLVSLDYLYIGIYAQRMVLKDDPVVGTSRASLVNKSFNAFCCYGLFCTIIVTVFRFVAI